MSEKPEAWHLSRSVPLALIFTIAVQTAAAIWFAAQLSAKVSEHTGRIEKLETADQRHTDDAKRMTDLLSRLDERMLAIQRSIDQISRSLPSARSN